jgi:hypothetical protein
VSSEGEVASDGHAERETLHATVPAGDDAIVYAQAKTASHAADVPPREWPRT